MISSILENEIISKFYQKGYFEKIKFTQEELKYIKSVSLSKKYIRAMIANHIGCQIIKTHNNLNHVVGIKVNSLDEIIKLSVKHNIPPYKLAKYLKYNVNKKEQKILQKKDIYTHPLNIHKIQKKAKKFEIIFEHCLIKLGFQFKTENDLRADNYSITPDFYFPNGIIIDKQTFFWIDVKNFYGSSNKCTLARLKKQAAKYNDKLGLGCFVFKYDFCEDLIKKFGLSSFSYKKIKSIIKLNK